MEGERERALGGGSIPYEIAVCDVVTPLFSIGGFLSAVTSSDFSPYL